METLADKIIDFNKSLEFRGSLPEGIRIMNPFRENEAVMPVSSAFYHKYYHDHAPRHLILGINPGRFGAGLTGIPFTDPKHLTEQCGIDYAGPMAHEPSSVFVYDMMEQKHSTGGFTSARYALWGLQTCQRIQTCHRQTFLPKDTKAFLLKIKHSTMVRLQSR